MFTSEHHVALLSVSTMFRLINQALFILTSLSYIAARDPTDADIGKLVNSLAPLGITPTSVELDDNTTLCKELNGTLHDDFTGDNEGGLGLSRLSEFNIMLNPCIITGNCENVDMRYVDKDQDRRLRADKEVEPTDLESKMALQIKREVQCDYKAFGYAYAVIQTAGGRRELVVVPAFQNAKELGLDDETVESLSSDMAAVPEMLKDYTVKIFAEGSSNIFQRFKDVLDLWKAAATERLANAANSATVAVKAGKDAVVQKGGQVLTDAVDTGKKLASNGTTAIRDGAGNVIAAGTTAIQGLTAGMGGLMSGFAKTLGPALTSSPEASTDTPKLPASGGIGGMFSGLAKPVTGQPANRSDNDTPKGYFGFIKK